MVRARSRAAIGLLRFATAATAFIRLAGLATLLLLLLIRPLLLAGLPLLLSGLLLLLLSAAGACAGLLLAWILLLLLTRILLLAGISILIVHLDFLSRRTVAG